MFAKMKSYWDNLCLDVREYFDNYGIYHILDLYFFLYGIYIFIWKLLFKLTGPIYFIYTIESDNRIKNITLNYYSRIRLSKYNQGKYFCKILDEEQTKYITYHGELNDIFRIHIPNSHIVTIKRKNVTIFNNQKPVSADLNILDNYYKNILHLKSNPPDLTLLLKCFGINGTHIQIINFAPFSIKLYNIQDLNLQDLYE